MFDPIEWLKTADHREPALPAPRCPKVLELLRKVAGK